MHLTYLLPFFYFARTRLLKGSLAFHVMFEWGAAALVLSICGVREPVLALRDGLIAYLAFICLYEIGYLFNDLVSSKQESTPRLRGPQTASAGWLATAVSLRLGGFMLATVALGMYADPDWWRFFGAMAGVFALHNSFADAQLKASTFVWLAWFRFMAPMIFFIAPTQRFGVCFGAMGLYVVYRLYGYLDSKGLLNMEGRKQIRFRATHFVMPLFAVVATWGYVEAQGFRVLTIYLSGLVLLWWVASSLGKRWGRNDEY
jgi:hypothetical protein